MKKIITASLGMSDAFASPIRDFAVVVENNSILETGVIGAMQVAYPDAHVQEFEGMLMMPAFVNSHDHGRGFGNVSIGLNDETLEVWLLMLRSQPAISPYLAAVYDGVRLLGSGVTLTAHSHNPLRWSDMHVESVETLRGYHEAGIRVAFHPPVVDQNMLVYGDDREFVDALSGDVRDIAETLLAATQLSQEDYFELCDNLYKAHHDSVNALVHIQVSPAGGQWCSDELILKAVEFAKQNQTRVQMHMLETHLQEKYAYRKWSKSFLKHLDEIGALGPWLTLAHMIWIAPEDFSLLAKRGVAIAHNPSSNLRVRSGIAALTNMVNAEIPLGIGLDGFALDEDQDYLREMRLALTLANHRSNQPGSRSMPLSAQTILHMGTHGGAQVTLGDDIRLGKLAKGYFADLIVLDLNFSPLDFLSDDSGLTESILRLASRKHVKHVMVAGEWLVKNGKHVRLDEESLHSEIVRCLRKQPRPSNHPAINDAKTLAPYVTAYYERWQKE